MVKKYFTLKPLKPLPGFAKAWIKTKGGKWNFFLEVFILPLDAKEGWKAMNIGCEEKELLIPDNMMDEGMLDSEYAKETTRSYESYAEALGKIEQHERYMARKYEGHMKRSASCYEEGMLGPGTEEEKAYEQLLARQLNGAN